MNFNQGIPFTLRVTNSFALSPQTALLSWHLFLHILWTAITYIYRDWMHKEMQYITQQNKAINLTIVQFQVKFLRYDKADFFGFFVWKHKKIRKFRVFFYICVLCQGVWLSKKSAPNFGTQHFFSNLKIFFTYVLWNLVACISWLLCQGLCDAAHCFSVM